MAGPLALAATAGEPKGLADQAARAAAGKAASEKKKAERLAAAKGGRVALWHVGDLLRLRVAAGRGVVSKDEWGRLLCDCYYGGGSWRRRSGRRRRGRGSRRSRQGR